jgi:broad specificity phosphatase PhoE
MVDVIHLVRHGEVDNPDHVVYADLPGFGLSETGWAQATAAGAFLANRPVIGIYSSPLTRAMQTAEAIAEPHRMSVEVVDALTEFGLSVRWRGVRWEDLSDRFPGEIEAYLSHPWDLPFSPEPLEHMMERMVEAVQHLAGISDGGEVVIVSHQDPVQAALVGLTDRPLTSFPTGKPGHTEVITLQPANLWREVSRWSPPIGGRQFPPPPGASGTI